MATITVDIRALTGSFVTDVKRAEREFKNSFGNIERLAKGVGVAVGTAAAAAASGLAALTKAGIDYADSLNDMATRTGIGVEQLSRLGVAAKLSNTTLESLQTAVGKLAKAQTDAARGGQAQIDLFHALGVEFQNTNGTLRASNEVLREVADVFAKLPEGPERAALALKLFGKSGMELIPFLTEGAAGLAKMDEMADKLGITISKDTARAAAEFNDRIDLMGLAVTGLGAQLAAELLPHLLELSEGLTEIVAEGGVAREVVDTIGDAVDRVGLEFDTAAGLVDDFLGKLAKVGKWWHENSALSQMGQWLAQSHLAARADWGSTTQAGGTPNMDRLGPGLDPSQRQQSLFGLLSPAQQEAAQARAAEDVAAMAVAFDAEEEALAAVNERLQAYLTHQADARAAEKAAREAMRAAEKAARDLASAYADIDQALARQRAAISPLHAIWVEYEEGLAAAAKRAAEMEEAHADLAQVDAFLAAEIERLTDARDRDIESTQEQIRQREEELDVAGALRRSYETEIRLLGMSEEARRVEERVLQEVAAAQHILIGLTDEEREAKERAIEVTVRKGEADLEAARKSIEAMEEVARAWENFTAGLGDALADAIVDGGEAGIESLKRAFKDLQRDMTRGFIDAITSAFKDGGVQGVIAGFQNNFNRGTGFRSSAAQGGGVNWGNVAQTAAGAYGVYDAYRNGSGGWDGAGQGAMAGAQAGAAFGPWGAIIGGIIGAFAGYFGGGEPTIRVSDREQDATARSRLDDVIGVARDRMEPGTATAFADAIRTFDNTLADIFDSYSSGAEDMERVRDVLENWSIRVEGDAATIENVLGERFGDILATFSQDVQDFVNEADTLEDRISRFAEVLLRADKITSIMDAFREGDMLADMTEAERALYALNQQFDAAVEALEGLEASEADIAEIEEYRARAIARLTGAQTANTEATEEAVRAYADFVSEFTDGGGSEFQRALRDVQRELEGTIEQANELARAAGLQAAREEDLIGARQRAQDQIADLIAGLTETVIQQIADLYGTSAQQLEQQIAAIDAEIAAMDRSDSTFGMLFNMQREAQLGAERVRLQEEMAAALEEQERIQRRMGALDLAQNLADLGLARGVAFEDLASDLGLNLDRFGADLGITAEAVGDFIRALEADSLTADVYGQGVQQIVDAILATTMVTDPKPVYFDDDADPSGRGGKALDQIAYAEPMTAEMELIREELIGLRVESAQMLERISVSTASTAREMQQMVRAMVRQVLDREANRPRNERLIVSRPKGR